MDRNLFFVALKGQVKVALRKESVDRNPLQRCDTARGTVALRKESVDRNIFSSHLPVIL